MFAPLFFLGCMSPGKLNRAASVLNVRLEFLKNNKPLQRKSNDNDQHQDTVGAGSLDATV
jgi:hypothetical protein